MKYKEIADELKYLLAYDPATGIFTWLEDKHGSKAGDIAGCKGKYAMIRYKGKQFQAHDLAWYFSYGDIPEGLTVDHRNQQTRDNRINNLRLATPPQQSINRSGLGYSFSLGKNKFISFLSVGGKNMNLGSHYCHYLHEWLI
jgi:hypothetical protein